MSTPSDVDEPSDEPSSQASLATDEDGEAGTAVKVLVVDALPEADPGDSPAESGTAPSLAWVDDAVIYRREAEALASTQPRRAALMHLEAAAATERSATSSEAALADVRAALALQPEGSWLLPLARRSLMRQRQFDLALEIAEREVAVGGANAARVAVLQEAAALVSGDRGDREGALALLEQALALEPGDVASLSAAAALEVQLGRWQTGVEKLEQLGARLADPQERALYLVAAGTLRETRLAQDDEAEADYRQAVEHDRRNLVAAQALVDLQQRRGQWRALPASLEHVATLADDEEDEARLLFRAGSLHLDVTGDLEAALTDLRRAVEAAPREPSYVQRLAFAYEAKGHTRDQVAALRRLLDLTLDAEGRAAILTHTGDLLQARLDDVDGAIGAYREALSEVEGHLPALQSLGTLYRQLGDDESLLAISAPEVEGRQTAAARAVRCHEMGDLLAGRLGRPVAAVDQYRRALALDPSLHLAFWAQRRLLAELGLHEALAALLAEQSSRARDARTANALRLELAALQAGALSQPEQAIETLRGLDDPDRTRTAALERLALYEHTERFAERVTFLLELAQDSHDAAEARSWRLQAALVLEHELEEHERALAIFRQVIEADPDCVLALRGAGRIIHRLARWSELVALHEHELATEPDRPDAPMLHFRIGRILETHLGETAGAIEAYSQALQRDSAYLPALTALESLVRRERRWEELVNVLQKYAAVRTDQAAAAEALCRAAEVSDVHLGDPGRAESVFRDALALNAHSDTARRGLIATFLRQTQWAAASESFQALVEEADSTAARAQLQLRLARLREHRLDQAADAALYQAAAKHSPYGSCLRLELTRILRGQGTEGLARWLEHLGSHAAGPALAAAYLLESAHLSELGPGGEPQRALNAARAAHAQRPSRRAVIWCLERCLLAAREWAELAALQEAEARLELDPLLRAMRLAASAVAHLRAGASAEAERVAHECLNSDAHSLPALRVSARVAAERSDWAALAELQDRIAEASSHPDNRFESCLAAADLWLRRVGDDARGQASLWVALTDQPGQIDAFERAERLHRGNGQFVELSSLYRRRIEACEDIDEVVALRLAHARLLRDDLGDADRAIHELGALLDSALEHPAALTELSELLVSEERWSDAVETLERRVLISLDDERRAIRLELAALALKRLHEPQRARAALVAQLAEMPDDLEAQRLLVAVCTSEGRWGEARRFLDRLCQHDEVAVRVWALIRLSEVARLGLRDVAQSGRCELAALELVATEPGALELLPDDYWTSEAPADRLTKLERVLDDHPDGVGTETLRAIAGRIALERLGEPARAIAHVTATDYEQAGHEDVHLLLAEARERNDELEAAAADYRAVLEREVSSIAAYRGLVRVTALLGRSESAAAGAALVGYFGVPDAKEKALLRGLKTTGPPAGAVDLASMPVDAAVASVHEALAAAAPYLDALYPTYGRELLPQQADEVVAVRGLAAALGLGEVKVSQAESPLAKAGLGRPVPVLIAPSLLQAPGDDRFRFWVGRALGRVATHAALLDQLSDADIERLVAALTERKPSDARSAELRRQLAKLLPRKLRRQLDATEARAAGPERFAAYRTAEQRRSDRLGLLFCRHPGVALTELAADEGIAKADVTDSPRLVALMRYAVSDDYAKRSRALWH